MKHFKLMKGILACLLSLALVLTIGGTIGAKAAVVAGKFNASVADGSDSLVEIESIKAGSADFDCESDWTEGKITVTAKAKTVENKVITEVKFGDEVVTANSDKKYVKEYDFTADGLEIIISATAVDVYDITLTATDADKKTDDADLVVTGENADVILKNEKGDAALALTGIVKDTDVKFTVALKNDKKQVKSVKVGTTALTAEAGVYTYKVSAATTIAVEIEDKPVILASYDVANDKVVFSSNKEVTVLYATVKKAGSKVSKTSEINLAANTAAKADVENDEFIGTIVLNSTEGGVKVAENKDLYLWYGISAPDKKATVKPLLTVEGTKVKKFTVVLNYAVAGDGDKSAIASATTKSGKNEVNIDLSTLQYRYYNGTEWGDWTDIVTVGENDAITYNFNGAAIQTALTAVANGDVAYEIKVKATAAVNDDPQTTDKNEAKNAVRGSKAVKIKVVKPATAPKVKVDYVKETVAIKSGYDYVVTTDANATASSIAVGTWKTLLPAKKGGTATGPISTVEYVPAKKVTSTNAAMFAKDKVKNVAISDLFKDVEEDTIYVYVRKSATAGKPASEACEKITIKKAAAAPSFTTVTVNGTYNAKKKTFSYVLEAPEALTDGTYEYLIVKEADLAKLDDAKWSKLTKGITVDKAKSKVGKSVTNILKADGNYLILIRKAAVKSGENAALASNYVITTVPAPVKGGTTEEPTSTITWSVKS